MTNIKAIAFDLGGVLIKENDYPLNDIEQILEKQFGNINTNNEYYKRAIETTKLGEKDIKNSIENIVNNIYELREPSIFKHLPKVKLAIASNQLSHINSWIDQIDIRNKFDCILISGDIGIEKPNIEFYKKLIFELKEKPENILFIDDSIENIQGAKKVGLSTLHYNLSKSLTDEILNYLNNQKIKGTSTKFPKN